MKILFLDHAPALGGAEMATLNLASALDRARFQPFFLTSGDAALHAQLVARDIPSEALYLEPLSLFSRRGLRQLARSVRTIVRLVRRERVDVLQSATARMHIVGALAAPIVRVPLVWQMQDVTLPHGIVRVFGIAPRRVTAVSNFIVENYRGALKNVEVIYPGVAVPRVDGADALALRDKFKIPRAAPLILNVGRLIRAKGQDVLLRAASQIVPETRVHVALVGAAEDLQYTGELRELRERFGLHVTLTGYRDDVAHWIAASDVCVYSAVEPEGLGMAILEAMAMGKPLIASAVGGARELVRENETGALVPPRDADALANALERLLRDKELRERMGNEGKARVEREFTMTHQVARYQAIYDALKR